MNKLELYAYNGDKLTIEEENEKFSGGEGKVYSLPLQGKNEYLVKVYKDEILRDSSKMKEISRRISDMVKMKQFYRTPFFAWPIMKVMNARQEVIGFAMRKCAGSSFKTLCGPRFIRKRFPGWTRRQLAMTALDFVRKVRMLAAYNIFINDFNPQNFLVNDQGEVMFIDCDSYQVPSSTFGVNVTRTIFPTHVAPELLMDKSLLDKPRTIHQVEFGTALTVFNIILCGQHPYNYCDAANDSQNSEPISLEENLRRGRSPLLSGSDINFPKGVWYNLWSWLPYDLKNTFVTMFGKGHSNPNSRPSLMTLQTGLETFLEEMNHTPEEEDMEPRNPKSVSFKVVS